MNTAKPQVEALEARLLPSQTPANVLLIVTDDQRWDTVSYMPFLSQLPATFFTNGFVTTPLCVPSRGSILTGQYPSRHGATSNPLADLFPDRRSVAVTLDNAGYYTGLVGKYIPGRSTYAKPAGWDYWHTPISGAGYMDPVIYNGQTGQAGLASGYITDIMASRAARFLQFSELRDQQPWFLYVAFDAPHDPTTPAPRHANAAVKLNGVPPGAADVAQQQVRSLLAVDEAVQSLFAKMQALGELRDTIVIFTSDNGYEWGEHGVYGKGSMYDPANRVPLVIYVGWDAQRQTRTQLAANIDIAPTILDFAGLARLARMDGMSLRPTIQQNTVARDFFFMEYAGSGPKPAYRGVRTATSAYFIQKDGKEYLFDLQSDPGEYDNLLPFADPTWYRERVWPRRQI